VRVTAVAAFFLASPAPSVEELVDHVGLHVSSMLVSNWRTALANPDRVDPGLRRSFERGREAFSFERAGGTSDANLRAYETYMTGLPDWQRELVDEPALRAKVLWGAPSTIRERLARLEELGVGRVVLYPDQKDPSGLEHFAEQFV
jgi:alkanesulfonate monooxygenase SsuD/methylene tetrahydromethanopterin reductase-like flavin-dependent oxidoreductase (luciferase family)